MASSPLLIHSAYNMEEFKLKPNCLKEIGYGQLFGCYQDIMNMVNGQLVDKLISWRAEEMLIIQNNLEEVHKHSAQLCIGDLTTSPINILKQLQRNQHPVEHGLMIFIHMVYIGTAKCYIPMLTLMLIEFYKLIILNKVIGKDHRSLIDKTLGNTQRTKMLHLIDLFI